MAAVEQQILVKIKALVDGLPQVQALANSVQNLNKGGSGFRQMGQDADTAGSKINGLSFFVKDTQKSVAGLTIEGEGAASVLLSAGSAAVTFGAALVAIGAGAAALGFGAVVAEGIRFNATLESSRISIATLVANTYDVVNAQGKTLGPAEAFNASLEKSVDIQNALLKSSIDTGFLYQDILTFFNSSVIASAGLKTNLDQLVSLTQEFALAAHAAGVETEKVKTGIQQIFTGNVTARNPLARVIFPGETTKQINEFLKQGRAAGDLADLLEQKLLVFKLSGDAVKLSFAALSTNVVDAFKIISAAVTAPLFDKIKEVLGFIVGQVFDLTAKSIQLTAPFQVIADTLAVILGYVGDDLLTAVKAVFGYIGQLGDYLGSNKDQVAQTASNFHDIADEIAGIALDLLSVLGDVASVNSDTQNWADGTHFVALWLASTRDFLNIIVGLLEAMVGIVGISLAGFLRYIDEVLTSIIDSTGGWLKSLGPVAVILDRIATSIERASNGLVDLGTNRLVSGLDQTNLAKTFAGTQQSAAGRATPDPVSFRSRKGSPDGGKAKADKAANARIAAAQKLYDAIEKYQIANANREVELFKLANDQIETLNKRRYDQGLISAEDYYAKKQALELDDLQHQEDSLNKQKAFADEALSRDLGAISGKFSLGSGEVDSIVARIGQAQADPTSLKNADPKLIKQATAYVKYLEQTAKITQDLAKIEKDRQNIGVATTDAIKDQLRVRTQQKGDIQGELASTLGQDGVTETNNLKKRISDELGKHLVDENQGVPGVEQAATAIRDLGSIDISGVTDQLKAANVDVDSLSTDTQTLLKLFTALELSVKLNATSATANKIKSRADFDRQGVADSFDQGSVNSSDALAANALIKKQVITDLTTQYDKLKSAIDTVTSGGGIVDPAQVQNAAALGRLIEGIKDNYGELEIIQKQADRDATKFAATSDAIDARRVSGAITAKQAQAELRTAQQAQVVALQAQLTELLKLNQALPDVAAKVAAVTNQISVMTNNVNAQSIALAQSINGVIGDAFNTFLDNIISGTQSIGDSFKQLVAGLLLGIAKAIAQAILLKYILGPLGLTGDDSGGAGGFFSSLFGGGDDSGGFAEGGIISGPGTGVSDSIPAMLSHGEGVIPAARVQGYGRGMIQSIIDGTFLPIQRVARFAIGGFAGGGSGTSSGSSGVRIINTVDPNLVKEFMQSAAGEEIITNVIGRNPGLVQRLA